MSFSKISKALKTRSPGQKVLAVIFFLLFGIMIFVFMNRGQIFTLIPAGNVTWGVFKDKTLLDQDVQITVSVTKSAYADIDSGNIKINGISVVWFSDTQRMTTTKSVASFNGVFTVPINGEYECVAEVRSIDTYGEYFFDRFRARFIVRDPSLVISEPEPTTETTTTSVPTLGFEWLLVIPVLIGIFYLRRRIRDLKC